MGCSLFAGAKIAEGKEAEMEFLCLKGMEWNADAAEGWDPSHNPLNNKEESNPIHQIHSAALLRPLLH